MKNMKVKQYAFIRKDEEGFQEKLNTIMRELYGKDPDPEFGEDEVIICYTETLEAKETPPSEAGYRFTCEECPMFDPVKKRDGTPDYRSKYGECPHAEMHRTWKGAKACDVLYMMLKNGDLRLTPLIPKEPDGIEIISINDPRHPKYKK